MCNYLLLIIIIFSQSARTIKQQHIKCADSLILSQAVHKAAVAVTSATTVPLSALSNKLLAEGSSKATIDGNRTLIIPIARLTPYTLGHQAFTNYLLN